MPNSTLSSVRLVHIPKTGTSFIITLRNHLVACKTKDYSCLGLLGGGFYGVNNPNGRRDSPVFASVEDDDQHCGGALQACQGDIYHEPFISPEVELRRTRPPSPFDVDAKPHCSWCALLHPTQNGTAYVTVLRSPVPRLLSALRWNCSMALIAAGSAGASGAWEECLHGPGARNTFNVMTNMLLGYSRLTARETTPAGINEAFRRLLTFSFFGITEAWAESVCL